MYEIAIGKAERDLFDAPGPGHRTYRASDGHAYTGTDTWDVLHACSAHCRDALTDDYPVYAAGPVRDGARTAEAAYVFEHGDGLLHDACVYPLEPDSVEDHHLPLVCAHCDTVLLGPATPTSDHPDPHNYTITVRYDNGRTSDTPFTAIDAAVAHAMSVAQTDAARHPAITLATGPDHLGPARHRRLTPPPT
jgi:hypothetical protein